MTFWSNLIGYQVVWLIAVIEAGDGRAWPGLAAGFVFVTWQLLSSSQPRADARLLLLAIGVGCVVDGVLAGSGWARYSAPEPALPNHGAPVWILALWGSFSMTLNRSLSYLRDRPWLAAVFGASGAPLAYLAAQRGWRAVVFEEPFWHGLLWLSCTWAMAMLLFAWLARRWAEVAGADGPVTVETRGT